MSIAHEILNQLGGNRFIAMTGAKNLIGHPDGLSFRIGRNGANVNYVKVTLTASDDYTVEFKHVRSNGIKTIALAEGVYNDNLQAIFTEKTGLYTRM
jgi:hypothetical protein